MNEINSIVVGIDYSENCANALREASRIANWNDAKLVCLHVIEEDIIRDFRLNETFDEQRVLDAAKERVEAFVADTVGAGHKMECKVVAGHPFGEVLSTIEATGAELLVLGSHGLKSDDFRRIGMLARRCVRKVPADVLLVRERQHEPFRCVVACVDFSENSIRAAYRAVDIAIQENAALEILHIYCPPIYPATDAGVFGPVLPPIDTSEIVGTLRARLDRLATELSNYGDGYDVRARVEEHVGVSGGIVRRLGEIEADLVILGTRGRTGLKGLFIGTTAERLIHEAPCSAFTVKPEGFAYTAH